MSDLEDMCESMWAFVFRSEEDFDGWIAALLLWPVIIATLAACFIDLLIIFDSQESA